MMSIAATVEAHVNESSKQLAAFSPNREQDRTPTGCPLKWEQVAFSIEVVWPQGLGTAAGLMDEGRLADELRITVCALNYKISGERSASDADIRSAAVAHEGRGEHFLAHARKLRAVLARLFEHDCLKESA
ncbi:hypothetical protein [Sphingomonas faeni]|uniref:hypothetical protein n=2 Tax=Sphingomonas faeni TaxID=185950 RepID=UPI003365284F